MAGYFRQRSKAGHTMTRPRMHPEPDVSALRQFYAAGGYCAPEQGYAHGGPVADDLSLYQSQYYAQGGKVDDDLLAYDSQYYAGGGAVSHLRNWLRTLAEGLELPIGVRANDKTIPQIIEDGRFKSQFETGRSNGSFDPQFRKEVEKILFGHPEDLPNEARPVYGSLFDPSLEDSFRSAGSYGNVMGVAKPSVKDRSTFTWDDSFGALRAHRFDDFADMRPKNPPIPNLWDDLTRHRGHLGPTSWSPNDFRDMWRNMGNGGLGTPNYIETQTHGGLPLSDLSRWIWDDKGWAGFKPNFHEIADKTGIPVIGRDNIDRMTPKPWFLHEPGSSTSHEIGPTLHKQDLGYAMGGAVDPNAGQSGIGVYDMSVDGPSGYAGGGEVAIKFIKNLLGHASPVERGAIEDVARHTKLTGSEGLIYGYPSEWPYWGHRSDVVPGDSMSVTLPPEYKDFIKQQPDRDMFTVHTHPDAMPVPSVSDLQVWRNQSADWKPSSPHNMWIKSIRGDDDAGLALLEPNNRMMSAYDIAQAGKYMMTDIYGRSPFMKNEAKKHLTDFAGSSLPENDWSRYLSSLEYGWYANELAKKGMGFNIEGATRLSPHSPTTVEEAWPELIKYYNSIGYRPYAEGGSVEDYAGGGLVKWLQRLAEPIKAYHGSPHTFDKFDASHIGAGEGNQVYGHGLYFAENPEVARYYRESLAGKPEPWQMSYEDIPIYEGLHSRELPEAIRRGASELHARLGIYKDPSDPKILHRLNQDLQATLNNAVAARREGRPFWSQKMNEIDKSPQQWNSWDDYYNEMNQDALSLLQHPSFKITPGHTPGSMYEVGLHADPESFLNLDKHISDLSPKHLDALKQAPTWTPNDQVSLNAWWSPKSQDAEILRDLGIPGTRYLDQNSRPHGEGTHNYVVFPGAEDIIEILNRYALGGSVGDDE